MSLKPIKEITQDAILQGLLTQLDVEGDLALSQSEVDQNGDSLLDRQEVVRGWTTPQLVQVRHALFDANLLLKVYSTVNQGTDPLESIPGRDLVYMLDWVPDTRMTSFSDAVYDWYQKTHPQISQQDFLETVRSLPSKKVLDLVHKYLATKKGSKMTHLTQRLDHVRQVITDSHFRQEFEWANEHLGLNKAKTPFYEIFVLFQQPEGDRQTHLSTLKTADFYDFLLLLENDYGINPYNELRTTIENYLDPPRLAFYRQPTTQAAFKILREKFPRLNYSSIHYVDLMDRLLPDSIRKGQSLPSLLESGEYEKRLQQIAEDLAFVETNFNLSVTSAFELEELARSHEAIPLLRQPPGPEAMKFLHKHYPQKVKAKKLVDLIGLDGIIRHVIQPLISLGVPPQTFDKFLQIFGLNLGRVDLYGAFAFQRPGLTIDYELLLKNEEFTAYVDHLFREYPSLRKNRTLETVANITAAFAQEEEFSTLNRAIADLKKGEPPEFDLDQATLKAAILREIKRQNLNHLSLERMNDNDISPFSWGRLRTTDDFEQALKAFESGEAGKLYDVLVADWKVSKIELPDFLNVLVEGEKMAFYLNPENAKKFAEIKEKYKLVAYEKENKYRTTLTLGELEAHVDVVEAYDLLSRQLDYPFIAKFFPHLVAQLPGKSEGWIAIGDLERLITPHILKRADLKPFVNELTETYGVAAAEVENFLRDKKLALNDLKDPRTKDTFQWMKEFYKGKKMVTPEALLFRALWAKDSPNAKEAFYALREMRFEMTQWSDVQYAARHLFKQEGVVQNLLTPDFRAFYKKVVGHFYGGVLDIKIIPDISELYDHVKQESSQLALLFSPKMGEVLSLVRSEFNVTDLHPSTLIALLQVAQNFDKKKMEIWLNWLKARGEKPTANDLVLISEAIKHPEWGVWLFNEEGLTKELEKIYRKKAHPRPRLDEIENLDSSNRMPQKVGHDTTSLDEEIAMKRNTYTERPSLAELPVLQLLRLKLIWEALQKPETRRVIGQIVSHDIGDKSTEYGGTIILQNGEARFNSVQSHSEYDGSYENTIYKFFTAGLATFHLHALDADTSPYSGPSGWLGAKGDIGYADLYDVTDVVITSMGHPKDEKGNVQKDQLVINVDVYFVDKRSREKKLRIIDLGTFIVPLDK